MLAIIKTPILLISLLLATTACEDVASVSILADSNDFLQATEIENKIDILWVVDNSGSMGDSQAAVIANFDAFIQDFINNGYDFQIAVITTDAYINGRQDYKASSGTTIITQDTENIRDTFISNINVGVTGSGWEKGMQSLEVALNHAPNQTFDFPRSDAFFSVIVVSDENDSSQEIGGTTYPGANYYLGMLDAIRLGDSIEGQQNYSINAIVRLPENSGCTSGSNGTRYIELAEASQGIVADICGDFADSLFTITTSIIKLSTQFYLKREPIIGSIKVSVDGEMIESSETNGWVYEADSNSILFNGSSVPQQGSKVRVDFDPVSLDD
ncbi:MAG: hypothetical protein AB8E15_06385 [Bdellovibrionales bacterium]